MKKAMALLICLIVSILAPGELFSSPGRTPLASAPAASGPRMLEPVAETAQGFEVEVLVEGRSLEEYAARGRHYVEALEGAEYQIRIRNPLGERVAVALSVDGLNTIDARRSSAFDASKWVIEPYGTITVEGWQMSSSRARRFYFTTERNSYGAKLGQTANLGNISAVFFRERRSQVIVRPPRPLEDSVRGEEGRRKSGAPSNQSSEGGAAQAGRSETYPAPDDDYAATGIGRNVGNEVRWVRMELQPGPVAELTIRYEYHDALVRLGVFPRPYPRRDTLRRRERATGFRDRDFSPEP
ncbi:MAG TPA: hypothetical protein VF723_13965 [Pyrinomonadaceae bacterium]|jgi:hypothetical protein